MKKVFLFVFMFAAMMLTSCSGKKTSIQDLPENLRTKVEMIDQQISLKMQEDNNSLFAKKLKTMKTEISYAGVSMENNDIVYTIRMGGKFFDVFTIEEFFSLLESGSSKIRNNDYGQIIGNNTELMDLLSQYGYHAVLRYQGNQADDSFDVKWPYDAESEPVDELQSISHRLPPAHPRQDCSNKIPQRDVLYIHIDGKNQLTYIDGSMEVGERVEIGIWDLKKLVKKFIANPDMDEHLPRVVIEDFGEPLGMVHYTPDHIISLQNDVDTPYQVYLDVFNELVQAYNELRDELAHRCFYLPYDELELEQKRLIQKIYPQKISEAEPTWKN